MNKDKLIDSIGLIDDKYIEESYNYKKEKSGFAFKKLTPVFGFFICTVVIGILFNNMPIQYKNISNDGYYIAEDNNAGYEYSTSTDRNSSSEVSADKKMIYNSSVSIITKEFDDTLNMINAYVKDKDGYFQSSSMSKMSNGNRYYNAVIRIPVSYVSDFTDYINNSFEVRDIFSKVDDITDDYNDLSARISSLKAQEETILNLYSKAANLEEIMLIEDRLSEVRYQIEKLETKIKNYDLLTDYATFDLDITETKTTVSVKTNFFEKIADSFVEGLSSYADGIGSLMLAVVYNIFPLLTITAAGYIIYRIYKKKH